MSENIFVAGKFEISATANVTKADFYEVLQVSRDVSHEGRRPATGSWACSTSGRDPTIRTPRSGSRRSEAYQVLSDPGSARRTTATAMRVSGGGAAGNPFAGAGFQGDLGDIFGDLFGEMFNMGGGGRRATRAQRGRDLRYDMTVEFEEAAFGVEKQIEIRRLEACEECRGTGSAKGKAPATCAQCGGHGQVRFQQGFFSVAKTCGRCNGTGTTIRASRAWRAGARDCRRRSTRSW